MGTLSTYKLKWLSLDEETWEPASNIHDKMIAQYRADKQNTNRATRKPLGNCFVRILCLCVLQCGLCVAAAAYAHRYACTSAHMHFVFAHKFTTLLEAIKGGGS
jgi:hypothetical protein